LTERIRKSFFAKRFFELFLGHLFGAYLIAQHMVPTAQAGAQAIAVGDYLEVLTETLNLAVPAAYMWLTIFYCLFHSYLNMWAELTRFGDRRFYSDWWNANNLSEYWRKWNHPIHNWLIRHVYYPLRRRKFSSTLCILVTFTVSAAFHEFLIVGIFSVVNFIAFILMMINVPAMILQRQLKNVISGNTNNTLFWLSYVILGQPFGVIFIFY
jgi:diacylglycerol O-acyltransferase 1